jgi:methanobactin biosynthesis cassette protein MbnB
VRAPSAAVPASALRSPPERPKVRAVPDPKGSGRLQQLMFARAPMMQIGFNFTLGKTYEMVQRMLAEGHIDFCELLIDNFFKVPADELARSFECPVGFHIMFSRYIESDIEYLEDMAKRLRGYIDAMQPLYVSDHIACFTHRGQRLFHLGEIDYRTEYERVRERVERWQDLIGERLLLENYPSIMDGGWHAAEFYERLARETGAGVLFDASNAVCALLNCGAPLEAWDNVIASTSHFHVAGYDFSIMEPHVVVDTHDGNLSPETIGFLERRRSAFDKPSATMTYERDANIDYDSIVVDLRQLRSIFSRNEVSDDARAACIA